MPANSPFVTAVGGTVFNVGGTASDGTRVAETASLQSGGGQSQIEPLPAFQTNIKVNGKRLSGRAGPDLAMAASTRGLGVNVFFDPTKDASAQVKWYTVEGTSVATSMFSGIVA